MNYFGFLFDYESLSKLHFPGRKFSISCLCLPTCQSHFSSRELLQLKVTQTLDLRPSVNSINLLGERCFWVAPAKMWNSSWRYSTQCITWSLEVELKHTSSIYERFQSWKSDFNFLSGWFSFHVLNMVGNTKYDLDICTSSCSSSNLVVRCSEYPRISSVKKILGISPSSTICWSVADPLWVKHQCFGFLWQVQTWYGYFRV